MDVKFFRDAPAFRRWLHTQHATAGELWLGFYRKGCGKTGISYPEAVDQALCYGWIDGVRKTIDEISYTNRFSPRKTKSIWSAINIRRVGELMKQGLMAEPGIAAFEARDAKRSARYSYENRPQSFAPELEKMFKANGRAWTFWEAQPPGYRRTAAWWVMSAVKDETRRSRLARVIDASARQRRVGLLAPAKKESARP
jgi:uncharacterized protein YdeI (YjbR/CyaY-like superfamily)